MVEFQVEEVGEVEEVEEVVGEVEEGEDASEAEVELTTETLEVILGRQNVENVDASQISHLNLDRQRIGVVAEGALAEFKAVTNLYLQHNCLKSLEFSSRLTALRFLCASHNKIETLAGLQDLQGLRVLDVSHNQIGEVAASELPGSLQFLMLKGNPCSEEEGDEEEMFGRLQSLPNLIEVDGKRVKSSVLLGQDTKLFSFSDRRRVLDGDESEAAENDRVRKIEMEVEAQIEREIEMEKAKLLLREDTQLSNEVERIKNTIENMHQGAAPSSHVNFRPAVDGLMHHARTEMINKVDAMKERCRIRRLNTQEYSEEITQEISKMKAKLRSKPFSSLPPSRPSTASSAQDADGTTTTVGVPK
ncbi:hypothetical protein HOP50_11g61700 [Chloropicon primus]|uniref:Leucine-rich repeat domain-containing protein n=1 Tax=Chloropicon primus TaxID=1764295 RepID=A0A5B8MVY1_9CHLO|nr:hypothetical protein A3770_11p61480 [Chloropicon primus]UPR02843.1 hypothetical protein HOP50_11g61700 [Chloropicon primus]|eukprot:QDZ23630.1 hypothetical protein A3770_11p61480 [Chloropicon primus]